jgi:hypothetical protein
LCASKGFLVTSTKSCSCMKYVEQFDDCLIRARASGRSDLAVKTPKNRCPHYKEEEKKITAAQATLSSPNATY